MLATSHIALFLSAEYIASIVTTLSNGLTAGSSSLKIASMKTMTSLATMIPQQSHLEPFYVLIEKMIHALQQLCMAYSTSDDEKELELATEFITCMIELGEERGTLFVPQLEPCFNSIMDIVESNLKPNSSINHLLVEFLVTLCSSITKQCRKIKSPTTAAEKGHFGARLLPYCAKMMLNVEFDPEWATSEELDDTLHEINDFTTGDNAFSEISSALGLRSTFTLVFDILKNLLSSPEESKKYAGLHIIANYVEVTCKIPDKNQLEQHRIDISTTLIGYTSDIHPRVRAASFYGIFKFASTHGDSLTQSQTDDFLKVLLSALSIATNPSPRVRQYALLGLISILDITPEESLGRWAGIILGQIANTLTESPLIVQEQCVTVISTLANSVDGEIMKNYYDSIMPILKQLLEYASSNKMEILWGSTLECCAMVGECVGKEKFHTDAVEMMNTLVSLQALEDMKKYLLKAWVRIARCMGKDFIPYLQPVMVQIFVAIEQNISQGTGDIDLDELDDLEKRSDIDIIEDADGMWIAVRTAAVEEQASACELLYLIVEKMQEDYFPYVEQTVKAMIPLLKSPQEDIRSHTVVVMPELIKCVAISCSKRLIDHQSLVQINSFVLGNLIEFVQTENIIELVMTGLQGIRQMILFASTKWDIVNPEINKKSSKKLDKAILTPDKSNPLLTVEQMNAISDCLQIVLRDSIQRRAILRAETQVNGDRDEDDIDDEKELLTTSLELCYNIGELMGALLRTHSYEYTKVFLSHWHEMIMNMVHVQCIKEDRQFACFVISDVIEFGFHMADDKQIVEQYFASVIPALVSINQGTIYIHVVIMLYMISLILHHITTTIYYLVSIHSFRHHSLFSSFFFLHSSLFIDAPELECRQISAYALGIAAQNFFSIFMPYVMQSLNSLASSSSKGRDQSTDNCISAIGIILEQVEMHKEHFPAFDFNSTWNQWLSYLPLKNDVEEGEKVILQLQRILASPNHVYLKEQIASRQNNGDELSFFLQTVLQQSSSQTHGNVFSSSPGMTAPIHDVLLGNR